MYSKDKYKKKYLKYKIKIQNLEKTIKGGYNEYYYTKTFSADIDNNEMKSGIIDIIQLMDGDLAIVDENQACIKIFNIDGNYKRQFGKKGKKYDEFYLICGITQLTNSDLAISDAYKKCIFIYDINGNYKHHFNIVDDTTPSNLIQMNNNDLAIVLSEKNNIQIYDISGNYKRKFGSFGHELGQFNSPNDIVQLNNDDLAILDSYNSRVQIFDIDGNYKNQFKIDIPNNTNLLISIIQLKNSDIAICNNEYKKIMIYDKNGNYITDIIKQYDDDSYSPVSIVQISNGNLLIADNGNNVIDVYESLEELIDIDINDIIIYLKNQYEQLKSGNLIKINYLLDNDNNKLYDYEYQHQYYKIGENNPIFFKKISVNIFNELYSNKDLLIVNNKKPFFKLFDIINDKYDEAIDVGGITKFIFYLLSEYLTKSSDFFEKDIYTQQYNFSHPDSLDNKEYNDKIYFLGQLFGLAIKLQCIIEINLDIFILYQMIHDNFYSLNSKEIIDIVKKFDSKLLDKLPYKCYDEKNYNQYDYCKYDIDSEQIELENLDIKTDEKIIAIYENRHITIENFTRGFRSIINITETKLYRLNLKQFNELISGVNILNYKTLMKYLKLNNFDNQEEINEFKNLIKKNICKNSNYIETLLLAMTSSQRIPIGGYSIENELIIELNDFVKEPYEIHTCFNNMKINKKIFNDFYTSKNKENSELEIAFSIDYLSKISDDFEIG